MCIVLAKQTQGYRNKAASTLPLVGELISIHPAAGITHTSSSGAELGLEGTEPLSRFGFLGDLGW